MLNENFEEIYDRTIQEVKKASRIERPEGGLLYKTLIIVCNQNESEAQEICNWCGIKLSGENDFKIAYQLFIDKVFLDPITKSFPSAGSFFSNFNFNPKSLIDNSMEKFISEEKKMEWIILAALTLFGLYYGGQRLQNKKQKIEEKFSTTISKPTSLLSAPAALCLVIPAFVASSLGKGESLSTDELIKLIDNASYFLCTDVDNEISKPGRFKFADDKILSESNQDVYIRIRIDNGQEMISKDIPYILKRALTENKKSAKIEYLACLESLSGLEDFHRV